jgi:hypothetical protein
VLFLPHRPEIDRQFVHLPIKAERHLVILVVHRSAGINADIEGLIVFPPLPVRPLQLRKEQRDLMP